ncbi:MAG: hypothetical protein KM310_01725 [Clostridiales bacterium]|nr:hypothetical protein [Clostridiales bacterium]
MGTADESSKENTEGKKGQGRTFDSGTLGLLIMLAGAAIVWKAPVLADIFHTSPALFGAGGVLLSVFGLSVQRQRR